MTSSQANSKLERIFKLKEHKTTVSTEIVAGITTFMTMVYIVFVNPQILGLAGMDAQAVFVVTCIVAAIGSITMGVIANLPIALAPAMGLNAFFVFSVVMGMGVSWQIGMGTIFWGAICFLLLSIFKIRHYILANIPNSLRVGIPAGIGFMIALIGLKNANIIVANPDTLVAMGDFSSLPCLLGFLSFFIVVILSSRHLHSAVLVSVTLVTAIALLCGEVQYQGLVAMPPSIGTVVGQLNLTDSLDISLWGVIFSFALVSLFDSSGTMIGVTQKCNIADETGQFPRMRRALLIDSGSSVLGAFLGTSTVTAYIESSAGVAVGGRTGLTAVITGFLFLGVIFFSPIAAMVPSYAVTGALVYVGVLMTSGLAKVNWSDLTEATPAFFTAVMMPFTLSITEGIACGFISYCVIKLGVGKYKEIHPSVALVALLFIIKYVFIK